MLDRRRFTSSAAMFAGFLALGAPAFAQTGKKWVCPPCTCGEDHVEHDAPGRCPGCGMPLVEKAQPAPPASAASQTPAQPGAPQTAKPAEVAPKPPQ